MLYYPSFKIGTPGFGTGFWFYGLQIYGLFGNILVIGPGSIRL